MKISSDSIANTFLSVFSVAGCFASVMTNQMIYLAAPITLTLSYGLFHQRRLAASSESDRDNLQVLISEFRDFQRQEAKREIELKELINTEIQISSQPSPEFERLYQQLNNRNMQLLKLVVHNLKEDYKYQLTETEKKLSKNSESISKSLKAEIEILKSQIKNFSYELDLNLELSRNILELENHHKMKLNSLEEELNGNSGYILQLLIDNLDNLESQFNNLKNFNTDSEVILNSLKIQIDSIHRRLDNLNRKINQKSNDIKALIYTEFRNVEFIGRYKIIKDRNGSRQAFLQALDKTQKHLRIVCPWLRKSAIEGEVFDKMKVLLDRDVKIELCWGNLGDARNNIDNLNLATFMKRHNAWKYDGLLLLDELQKAYPEQFISKMIGTHEKYWISDECYCCIGSHNFLSSGVSSSELEIGIKTSNPRIIASLFERFHKYQGKLYEPRDTEELEGSIQLSFEFVKGVIQDIEQRDKELIPHEDLIKIIESQTQDD